MQAGASADDPCAQLAVLTLHSSRPFTVDSRTLGAHIGAQLLCARARRLGTRYELAAGVAAFCLLEAGGYTVCAENTRAAENMELRMTFTHSPAVNARSSRAEGMDTVDVLPPQHAQVIALFSAADPSIPMSFSWNSIVNEINSTSISFPPGTVISPGSVVVLNGQTVQFHSGSTVSFSGTGHRLGGAAPRVPRGEHVGGLHEPFCLLDHFGE